MASKTEICNIALGRVGCQQFITSIDPPDGSAEARVCAAFFNFVLEKALQDFPWPFARQIVALQDVGSPVSNWGYRYRYPNDCLQLKRVFPEGGIARNGALDKNLGVPFKTISDGSSDGKAILCDYPAVYAEYTARVIKPALYPPAFVNLLAWGLAANIATPLSADAKYAQAADTAYQRSLAEAGALAASENQADQEGECDLDAARNA